jgi:putative lipoprotein
MLALVLALQLHAPGDHPAGDSWFGVDKVKHFFMGAFVQSVAYSAIRASGGSHTASLAGATGATAGVSVAKELWDAHNGGTPSVRDLVWDAAGAGTATVLLRRSVR